MKFSVLMSIYKKENPSFLDASLKSTLVDQTVKPNEVVIIKDGSLTSELEDVLKKYNDKFSKIIKIIELTENMGLGRALKIGVRNCSHNIIARMDSDDINKEKRFEIMLDELTKDNSISILGSYIDEFEDSPLNIVSTRKVPTTHEDIYNFAKRRNPFNHMSVIFKKDAILSVGNYKSAYGFEDYYLWARLLTNGFKGKNIGKSLVYARVGQDMFNRRGGIKYLVSALKVKWKIRRLGLSSNIDFLVSSFSHITVSLMPTSIRGYIYKKVLRR